MSYVVRKQRHAFLELILYEVQPIGDCEDGWIWVENNMKSFYVKFCYHILLVLQQSFDLDSELRRS